MEPTRLLPNDQKMRVARGWDGSGLTMADYAGRNGISERTLRTWRSIYASAASVRGARISVEKAIGQLQAVLNGLPPEPDPAGCRHGAVQQPERDGPTQAPPRSAPRAATDPANQQVAIPVSPSAPARATFDWNVS